MTLRSISSCFDGCYFRHWQHIDIKGLKSAVFRFGGLLSWTWSGISLMNAFLCERPRLDQWNEAERIIYLGHSAIYEILPGYAYVGMVGRK